MVKRKKKSEDNSVRNPGLKTLQQSVLKITDVAIRKRGFVESALIHKWTSIVGKEIAAWLMLQDLSIPLKMFLTLIVHYVTNVIFWLKMNF